MPEPPEPRAAVVVRNAASHDARVLRCARTLQSLGYEAVVIAVTTEDETAEHEVTQGVPIVRLTPRAPLAGLVRALRRGSTPRESAKRLQVEEANAWRSTGLRPLARAYRLLRTLSYYRHGIAAMRQLRPEVVHCNDYNTMWVGVAAKLLTGCTLVYDSHELWPDRNGRSEPRWWLLACEALFLRIADSTLATSPGHAAAIAHRHRVAPPRVVRNIPERPSPNGASSSGETPRAAAQLVYAGAVTGNRGLEQAIAALPGAAGVTLRVVGSGAEPYRERLQALAEERGVSSRLLISPPVPPQHVVAEISPASAGVALIQPSCLSYSLSLPNKLFEYLTAGLPILAADVPTIRAFVSENGVGLIVPPDDPDAIARAMLEIVEPNRNRELREAVAVAAARLSWAQESERLQHAYREATGVSP